jgi:hypothetical protein
MMGSSGYLRAICIALWVISLMLPAYSFDHAESPPGLAALLFGWLAPSFAWWANIPFWIAVYAIRRQPVVAVLLSWVAAVCSLHSLFPSWHLPKMVEHAGSVYGVGWGALLWLLAIWLLTVATAALWAERRATRGLLEPARKRSGAFAAAPTIAWVGAASFVTLGLASVVIVALMDRSRANDEERVRLQGVVFKLGPVCDRRQPEIAAAAPINGPIEIIDADGEPVRAEDALAAGIPVIRIGGWDIREFRVSERVPHWHLAAGPLAAQVVVEKSARAQYVANQRVPLEYRVLVRRFSPDDTVLDFTWELRQRAWPARTGSEPEYCPSFEGQLWMRPQWTAQQPLTSVLDALGLSSVHKQAHSVVIQTEGLPLDARLIGRGPLTMNSNSATNGCGSDEKLIRDFHVGEAFRPTTPFLRVGQENLAVLLAGLPPENLFCSEDSLWLTSLERSYLILVQRRNRNTLEREWTGSFAPTKLVDGWNERHRLSVSDVALEDDVLRISVVNADLEEEARFSITPPRAIPVE